MNYEFCATFFGFPELYPANRVVHGLGQFVEQFGEIFRRGVFVHKEKRFPLFLQDRNQRVVLVQHHFVVDGPLNPPVNRLFQVGKVKHHSPLIKRFRAQGQHQPPIVSMQPGTLAVVIQKPVAVTKCKFAGNGKQNEK